MEEADYYKLITSIIILAIVVYVLYIRYKKSRRGILLLGLRESGKTLTFSQLVYGKYVDTYTSLKENIGMIESKNGSLQIIDIPGHDQLRYKFFDQYNKTARAIVYIIDSTLNSSNLRDMSEFLYNIISDPVVLSNRLPILILCNKQDDKTALSGNMLKQKLEEEFSLLQVTKSSQLESVDEKSKRNNHLGKQGGKFKFENLPLKVSFSEACAKEEFNDSSLKGIDNLKTWLLQVA